MVYVEEIVVHANGWDNGRDVRFVERDGSLSQIGEHFGKRKRANTFDSFAEILATEQFHDHKWRV